MVKPKERRTLTNVFIVVVGILLVIGGYLLIGIMSILPSSDNSTKALVMLAILIVISSITQLTTLSVISNKEKG